MVQDEGELGAAAAAYHQRGFQVRIVDIPEIKIPGTRQVRKGSQ